MLIFDPLFIYGVPLASICTLVGFNFHRAKKLSRFPLQPNCLISRYPLVFISGIQSPFYFLKFWNQVPWYLQEHGYVIEEWNLPWRDDGQRKKQLSRRIENAEQPLHLFFDGGERTCWQDLIRKYPTKIASITFVGGGSPEGNSPHVYQLQIPSSSLPPTVTGILSKLSLAAHQLWSGTHLAAGSQGLGLPGKVDEVHYRKFLHHAVHLAEGDMGR